MMRPTDLFEEYHTNGYCCIDWETSADSLELRSNVNIIVDKYFKATSKWAELDTAEFHRHCLRCQDEIQDLSFQQRFLEIHRDILEKITGITSVFHESVIFLRAVRPSKKIDQDESLGFHRETMYSDSKEQTSKAHNIWIPLTEVFECNAVRYYEGSHKIPDSSLEIVDDLEAPRVSKGSAGHRLGNLYSPKKIDSPIEGYPVRIMSPKEGQFALFSAMTVHGGGKNTGNELRLSLSMALIDKNDIVDNKSYIAAGGRPHYVSL